MPVSVPTFIKQAWAAVGTKFTIPDNANPTTGRAGWDQGFSPINLTPVAAGGIPPFGQDMNGVLYDITNSIQYIQAGRPFPYNQEFADAIGGYGKGSLVSIDSDLSIVYKSKVDDNLTPPPSANWEISGSVAQATETVSGIAKIATSDIASGFVNNSDIITPARLASALNLRVGHSFTANDWCPLSGGVIAQWGTTTSLPPGASTITLPEPYTSAHFVALITAEGVYAGGNQQSHDSSYDRTLTDFKIHNASNLASTFSYISIGI